MVRRLTASQYRNTLVDIFGSGVPSEDVLIDPQVNGFHVDADAPLVQDLDAELLMNYAESVATWAADGKLSQFMSCTNPDSNCRRQFIQKFGLRVHREALPEDRIKAYDDLMAAEATFQAGAQAVVTAMLQSPYLLYRRELGQPDSANANSYKLTPYEVASELAYFLTDSAPNAQLLDAAAQNRLQTSADIDREASQLVNSQNARRALAQFVEGWLHIDGLPLKAKDDKQLKFTDSLRAGMLRETEEFFFDAFFSNKSVTDLFAAKYTFVNQELAAVYQLGGATSATFQRVDLTGTKRAPGILGQGAFLTAHALPENSSPVQRGVNVRKRILCQEIPPVPQNLNTNLASGASFTTNRERYQQHSADPVCAGCHKNFDPVGFAFEHFDAFGRYREQENGKAIDATGTLAGMPEGDIPLNGAESLIDYLSKSESVRSCVVRYWSYYAHGRDQWAEKQCNHDAIRREAAKQNYSLKSILTGITHAPHFTRRVKDK